MWCGARPAARRLSRSPRHRYPQSPRRTPRPSAPIQSGATRSAGGARRRAVLCRRHLGTTVRLAGWAVRVAHGCTGRRAAGAGRVGQVRVADHRNVQSSSDRTDNVGPTVRLAIADPPYPPFVGSGGPKSRASRWYGTGQRSRTDVPPDIHPNAAEWDDPARHRRLLADLMATYDGWAVATSPDGLAAYGELPIGVRLMAWIKPNAQPGAHRLRSTWEPVILYPPIGRRSNRGGVGSIPDTLSSSVRGGFRGAKPPEWTAWVLRALSYDPSTDTVDDLFPGSGAVTLAIGGTR